MAKSISGMGSKKNPFIDPFKKKQTKDVAPVGDDLMSEREEHQLRQSVKKAGSGGIEAYGNKGFKRTPWRKAFKSQEALEKWCDENDAEVLGTRSTANDAKDEAVLPVEDVEITYHLAEKPKQPAKLLSVADPKERKEMAAQPYRTKDDEVKPVPVSNYTYEKQKAIPVPTRGATAKEIAAYNAAAVQKEINKDKRIGGKEAKAIHALLKGRTGDAEELILWGVPKGKKDQLHAQILSTQAKSSADVERVKAAASKDGWHSFRVQKLNTKEDPSNMFGKKSLARDMLEPVGDAGELIEEYKGKKIKRGKRDDAVSVEGIGNAPRYFTGWTEAKRVEAAKAAIDRYGAANPPTRRSNTLIDKANRDIQYAVSSGELDADSDANEIRQVLASYPKEVQDHFVRDLGRMGDVQPVGATIATDANEGTLTLEEVKQVLKDLNRTSGGMNAKQLLATLQQEIKRRRTFYTNMGMNPPEDVREFAKFHKEQLSKAKDASPFDRDTDVGSAMQVLKCKNEFGMKPKDIAAKYGYSLQFVLDVGNGKFGKNAAAIKKTFNSKEASVTPVGDGNFDSADFKPGDKFEVRSTVYTVKGLKLIGAGGIDVTTDKGIVTLKASATWELVNGVYV